MEWHWNGHTWQLRDARGRLLCLVCRVSGFDEDQRWWVKPAGSFLDFDEVDDAVAYGTAELAKAAAEKAYGATATNRVAQRQ